MRTFLKSLMPARVLGILKKTVQKREYKKWLKNGCPVPPPYYLKQITIKEYQERYGYEILVETGTYLGDMVEAQKKNFKKIISIELSAELSEKAKKRFRNDKHIQILNGDSGKILPGVLAGITNSAIFWLDGHYSEGITAKGEKESPIIEELNAILKYRNLSHILLIDDARSFVGKGDYPSIEELKEYIKTKNVNYQIDIKDDIIRLERLNDI
jgi:hypothetical protein